jgi:hypothetical protein
MERRLAAGFRYRASPECVGGRRDHEKFKFEAGCKPALLKKKARQFPGVL